MVDSTGTTTWTYNAADQVVTLAQPAGTITYEYDDNARLWKMHQPGSLTTTYTYDFAWRLKQITNGYGEITTFDYDPASRVIKKSFANGTYETYSYDSRSRVEWIKLFNSSNQLLSQHQYTYDAVSNVLTRTDNGVTTTFGYDDIGQLISESRPGYSASYTYDKNGNRLTRTVNGVTEVYTYDDADKLLNIKVNGIVVKSFTYDMAGRTTGITDSGGTTSLVYDYEDRVTSIPRPGMTTNTFAYNGFGARVSKTDSAGTTTYLRSGTSVVAPVVADSGATYTPGISERRGTREPLLSRRYQELRRADGLLGPDRLEPSSTTPSATRSPRPAPGPARSPTAGASATRATPTPPSPSSATATTIRRRAASCLGIRSRMEGIGMRTVMAAPLLAQMQPGSERSRLSSLFWITSNAFPRAG
ncbi:MAG: hypothetical protein KatS3mg015_2687 [Fimbriimonadales bacterium]|nr:MAG: hypothetical protein KatS3mg015_2687 [Fimbriimonadales bacterium]